MPNAKRRRPEDFDLHVAEKRVAKKAESAERLADANEKSRECLTYLKEFGCLDVRGSAPEALALELIRADSFQSIVLAIQLVRDVGHLGPNAIAESCKAVCANESDRLKLEEACVRLGPLQADLRSNFSNFPVRIIAPQKVQCPADHDSFKFSTSTVTCYRLEEKSTCTVLRAYCRHCKLTIGPWASDESKSQKKRQGSGCKRYYNDNENVEYVEVNDKNFMHKSMIEFYVCQLHHSWCSFQGFAEAYSEALYNRAAQCGIQVAESDCRLSRKLLSSAFYEYEVWRSLQEQNDQPMERTLNIEEFIKDCAFQDRGLYQHNQKTTICQEKGCDFAHIGDGLWKLQYTLCMFQEKVSGPLGVSYPSNCREEPEEGKAFCVKHCKHMQERGYPTEFKKIVEKLGRTTKDVAEDFYESMKEANLRRKTQFSGEIHEETDDNNATDYDEPLRTEAPVTRSRSRKLLSEEIHEDLMQYATEIDSNGSRSDELLRRVDLTASTVDRASLKEDCFKNIGGRKRIGHWLRGHFFIVAPCGHILRWEPMFGSESPSQAYIIFIDHLYEYFSTEKQNPEDWDKFSIIYDNICHVAGLKEARKKLPSDVYPAPYDEMWLKINKVIDRLHIRNHRSQCQKMYNPDSLVTLNPDVAVNTMRAEQTFVWMGRFKKILCAMKKSHHHFTLNRLVTRRNAYTHWKNSCNKNVVLPKVRSSRTT